MSILSTQENKEKENREKISKIKTPHLPINLQKIIKELNVNISSQEEKTLLEKKDICFNAVLKEISKENWETINKIKEYIINLKNSKNQTLFASCIHQQMLKPGFLTNFLKNKNSSS